MKTIVINVAKTHITAAHPLYVYCGRCYLMYCGRCYLTLNQHFGNPFGTGLAEVYTKGRLIQIRKHREWLEGKHPTVAPDRLKWVLENLPSLKGKYLGCFCAPKKCHCDNYVEILESDNGLQRLL